MSESPSTRHSLLVQIRDLHNDEAWSQFIDAYAPLVYRYARRQGLQDADAADLTQDVLRSIVRSAGQFVYDPTRGRFRTWLYTVSRNKVINYLSAQKHISQPGADTCSWELVNSVPDPTPSDSAEWDREYERQMFEWACERVKKQFREASWQAFWQTAVEAKPAADVAAELAMTVGAVYIARSRVLAAIKLEVQRLVGEEEG